MRWLKGAARVFWYFVRVPELPREVAHQSNQVELVEYCTKEGQAISPGDSVAVVRNWWAVLEIAAAAGGRVSKTFFSRGTIVKVGDPIAIIECDGEGAPHLGKDSMVRLLKKIRERPMRLRARDN